MTNPFGSIEASSMTVLNLFGSIEASSMTVIGQDPLERDVSEGSDGGSLR